MVHSHGNLLRLLFPCSRERYSQPLLAGTPIASVFDRAVANKEGIRMLYRWLKTVGQSLRS